MGKKDQIIGIICIVCAFILLFKVDSTKYTPHVVSENNTTVQNTTIVSDEETNEARIFKKFTHSSEDKKVVLENDMIKVEFLPDYGAIDHVILKKYKKVQEQDDLVIINDGENVPALAMYINEANKENIHFISDFKLQYADDTKVIFSKIDENNVKIVREYNISAFDDPRHDAYTISHCTKFINDTPSALHIKNINFCLGTIAATDGDLTGDYLNFGYFDGKSAEFIKSRDFSASRGFFGLGKREKREYISEKKNIIWGSIKNQFFTTILTPSTRAIGFFTAPILADDNQDEGISAEMMFKIGNIEPSNEYSLDMDFYVGPKDFARLDRMSSNQDLVMQFGFFGIISKFLLLIMVGIHSIVSNWGLSIVLLTVIVKLCLWPLTTAQVRASKKMAAIQEPLRALKEKYKNNPSKVQTETMKLFKQYRVNPAAGCLPIFIQIPIFFGLYYMLRTSSDLRFAHFLWIKDLSVSDTIAHFGSFPINVLPLIMGATMALQMYMTPMPSADGSQKLMFKLMPVIFLFCCYSFPSGLVLYWTVQNILTIIQQYIVSKRRDMQIDQLLSAEGQLLTDSKKKNKKVSAKRTFTK